MFEIKTSLLAPHTDRLLKPRAALSRLRPVKLGIVAAELKSYYWCFQGAQLVGLTGAKFAEVPDHWEDMLHEILRQCEAWDWFPVDWDLLNQDYEAWLSSGEEEYFNQWLEFIPVERFGFSDYDEEWPEAFPPLALLKGLLDGDWGEDILVSLIDEYGLDADWHNITQYDLWQRLTFDDFSGYGPPLCWLPEMARIACGRTGHELLDWSNYFEDDPDYYCWSELERVKELWRTAKPTVQHMREFLRWCGGPDEMQLIVDALTLPPPKPKRKRKPKAKRSKLNTLVNILTPGVER